MHLFNSAVVNAINADNKKRAEPVKHKLQTGNCSEFTNAGIERN
jgi:hypothetical protein